MNIEKLRIIRDKLHSRLLANGMAGLPCNPLLKFYYHHIDDIINNWAGISPGESILHWLINHNGYKLRYNWDRGRYDFVSFDGKHWRQSFY